MKDAREATPVAIGQDLGPPSDGDINEVSGVQRDGVLCDEQAEYSRAIHRDATDFGPLQGDGTNSWYVGGKKVVGTGGLGYGMSEDDVG